jgi:hypothetical protein
MGVQLKEVSTAQNNLFVVVMGEVRLLGFDHGRKIVFGEEGFYRVLVQFNAMHFEAKPREPQKVFGFSTKGNQHFLPLLGVQLGEVLGEFVVIVGLVKIRPAGVPGIDPKFSVHGNP